MKLIVLVRHALNDYVTAGKLAGWLPGVRLNAEGQRQAAALAQRFARTKQKFHALYTSPLERARETAAPIGEVLSLVPQPLDAVGEVNFGQWQGRALKDLEKEDLWRVVQAYPSVVCFPGGESFLAAQARAVYSVEMIAATLQPEQAAIVVSHSDIIKAIVAYYAGMHLDQFQRLVVNPASITIIGLTPFRPAILRLNDDSHLPEPEPAPQESPATTEA